jgi:hypothetical protein
MQIGAMPFHSLMFPSIMIFTVLGNTLAAQGGNAAGLENAISVTSSAVKVKGIILFLI